MFKPIRGGSKIIVGEGLKCYLPPIPDKSQILFYNLPREEQYWKRQPLPEFYTERVLEEEFKQAREFELILAGKKKKSTYCDPVLERFRRREWHRRRYGVYMMNDGVPEYLTNHHYWYLQYCKYDHKENDGFPFYYEFSRDNFYVRQWCEENPRSLGYMFVGPRATGKSNEELAAITNRTTMLHNQRAALQSKHFQDDAKGVLIQAKTIPIFNNLPIFFKPQFSHGTNAQEELVFTRRSIKGEESRGVLFGPDLELQSRIFAAPPGEKALDTETLTDCFEDEIGKQNPKTVGDIYVRHETNVKCVFRNHRKIGIMRKTTTVEEMTEGGDECHKLWKDSDPSIVDNNGYTISKIHRHLISALKTDTSLEEYIDSKKKNWGAPCNKYGKINGEIANLKIQADLDAVKHDLKKVSSRMRKSPRNETEAFIKDQSKSIFNIQLLSNRLEKIRNGMAKKPYVRGNLYWLKDKFGPVGWQSDQHAGRFNWNYFPDEYTKHKSDPHEWKILNNFTKEWGYDRSGKSRELVIPHNTNRFKIASDPIKFTKTDDARASKAAAHGFRLFDPIDLHKKMEDWESHNFIFEYVNRPDDPETYYEDMAMACMFLGCKMLPERNIDTLNGYFKYNGLDRLLWYPQDEIGQVIEGLSVQQNSVEGGYASTPEVINYYTIRIMQFINKHIDRMPFDDTIESWMNFDAANPTKYDATVSSGYALIHAEKKEEEDKPSEGSLEDWFDEYDNSSVNGTFAERSLSLPRN